jgi:FixJ family two-component response regulator
MKGLMRSVGFAAEVFSSAEEFLHSSELDRTGFLIADVNMPGMGGLRLHETLLLQGKAIPTILITAYPSDHDRARALQAGVISYLAKSFDEHDLLDAIRSALDSDGARGSTS